MSVTRTPKDDELNFIGTQRSKTLLEALYIHTPQKTTCMWT